MDDYLAYARSHVAELAAIAGVALYGSTRKKLTTGGIAAGVATATLHMLHPWPAFFWLPIAFFICGSAVTKIGHARKAYLTLSSAGGSGGEGARSSSQVFANAGFACILIQIHAYLLNSTPFISSNQNLPLIPGPYAPALLAVLPIGIVAQYAAVASDTFSSELGILARGQPYLITAPWKQVPRGTNGGVTIDGLLYGLLGSVLLTLVAVGFLTLSPPYLSVSPSAALLVVAFGLAGSVIDSLLGALVQATVVDGKSGKVVEGPAGTRVKVVVGGSRKRTGWDLLTNNGVNFAMAAIASSLAMGAAWVWELELVR